MDLQSQPDRGMKRRSPEAPVPSCETVDLTCTQRLDRVRAYVLLMRDLRESAWRSSDGGPVAAG